MAGFGKGMIYMRTLVLLIVFLVQSLTCWALPANDGVYDTTDTTAIERYRDLISKKDLASVKRGGHMYVEKCYACHTLKYARYDQVTKSVGLTYDEPDSGKYGVSKSSITDMTFEARHRGLNWLFGHLISFGTELIRPEGEINILIPGSGLPSILHLYLYRHPIYSSSNMCSDTFTPIILGELKLCIEDSSFTRDEYISATIDLTNWLSYVSMPYYSVWYIFGDKAIYFYVLLIVFLSRRCCKRKV